MATARKLGGGSRAAWFDAARPILRAIFWFTTAVGLILTGGSFLNWASANTSRLSAGLIEDMAEASIDGVITLERLVGHDVERLCLVGSYAFVDDVAADALIPYGGAVGFAGEIGEHEIGLLAHGAGRTTYATSLPGWGPTAPGRLGGEHATRCYQDGAFAIRYAGIEPLVGGTLIDLETGQAPQSITLPILESLD